MTSGAMAMTMLHVPCAVCGADDARTIMRADELHLRERSRIRWHIARCARCGLVYVDPRPAAESSRRVYEGESYGFLRSNAADGFVDGRPHAERVLGELEHLTGRGRILDIGAATGDFLAAARDRGWQTYGVELSPHAAAAARRRGLEIGAGTLAEARLPSDSFDAVTMLDVIEHLPDPVSEVKEVHRVLRPGGILCVETPNWRSIYRRLLGRRWAALQPRLHLLYFDEATLRASLGQAGLTVIRASTEIVSLLTPEAAARGFGPAFFRSLFREATVRLLLRLPPGPLDRFFLNLGSAARANARAASFKALAGDEADQNLDRREQNHRRPAVATTLIRILNRPIDHLFLKLGMGEQLRAYARK